MSNPLAQRSVGLSAATPFSLNSLPEDMQALQDMVRYFQSALTIKTDAVASLSAEVKSLTQTNDNLSERSRQSQAKLHELRSELTNVYLRLARANTEKEELEEQVKSFRSRAEESKSAILRLQGEHRRSSSAARRRSGSVANSCFAGWNPEVLSGEDTSSDEIVKARKNRPQSMMLAGGRGMSPSPSASGSFAEGNVIGLSLSPSNDNLDADSTGDCKIEAANISRQDSEEVVKLKTEVSRMRAKLDEANEARRASDDCLKALRDFIGEGGPDGSEEARSALRGIKLPPLPTADERAAPADDALSSISKNSGITAESWTSRWTSYVANRTGSISLPAATADAKTEAGTSVAGDSEASIVPPSTVASSAAIPGVAPTTPVTSASASVPQSPATASPSIAGGLTSFFSRTGSLPGPAATPRRGPGGHRMSISNYIGFNGQLISPSSSSSTSSSPIAATSPASPDSASSPASPSPASPSPASPTPAPVTRLGSWLRRPSMLVGEWAHTAAQAAAADFEKTQAAQSAAPATPEKSVEETSGTPASATASTTLGQWGLHKVEEDAAPTVVTNPFPSATTPETPPTPDTPVLSPSVQSPAVAGKSDSLSMTSSASSDKSSPALPTSPIVESPATPTTPTAPSGSISLGFNRTILLATPPQPKEIQPNFRAAKAIRRASIIGAKGGIEEGPFVPPTFD